ncbi:saccharopine dehydrogenase NADP-binding domain-containing protein [Kineococcus sp. NUM-3379]
MRLAVGGATGFAGRLVTAEAVRRGFDVVLVGRDHGRLLAAARTAGLGPDAVRVAAPGDHDALVAALRGADAVVNCVSPFALFAEPVLRAAIDAGVHHVDISGEEAWIRRVLDTWAAPAAAAGVVVLPAANNDCLTGDLLGSLVAEGLGELETVSVAFDARDAEGSRGTVLMALTHAGTFRTGGSAWDGTGYVTGTPARRRAVRWPGGAEETPVVRFALPPAVTIPRHVRTRHAEGLATPEIQHFFSAATQELVDAMPLRGGPDPQARARARFSLVVDATAVDGRRRRAELTARDMYGTTAVIAVEAARVLAAGAASGAVPPGAWSPAQVLDPAGFLGSLAPHGVSWSLEDVPADVPSDLPVAAG